VLCWGGRLFALHESGLPHELDPWTLETLGEVDMNGSVEGKGPFAAHYRIVKEADGSRRWVTFGAAVGGSDASVVFYEYAENGAPLHVTNVTLEARPTRWHADMLTLGAGNRAGSSRDRTSCPVAHPCEQGAHARAPRILVVITGRVGGVQKLDDKVRRSSPLAVELVPTGGKGGSRASWG
jgi:Retinal pigment epithelial membrane protein